MSDSEPLTEKYTFLPTKLYELLRWVVVLLLPTAGWVIAGLDSAWNWGLPVLAITTTLDIAGTALGALFLGSKYYTDMRNK